MSVTTITVQRNLADVAAATTGEWERPRLLCQLIIKINLLEFRVSFCGPVFVRPKPKICAATFRETRVHVLTEFFCWLLRHSLGQNPPRGLSQLTTSLGASYEHPRLASFGEMRIYLIS